MKFIKNKNYILRHIHGTYFLINIADYYRDDKCILHEINETGMFLWKNLDENVTLDTLTKALQDVIVEDIPYSLLENDVFEYIEDLKSKHFVLEVPSNG